MLTEIIAVDAVAVRFEPWQATNLTGLRFTGLEGSVTRQPTRNQELKLGWTGISGAQAALHGLQSEYVFKLPSE
jgi:iron complex outermembrane receptor protein